MNPEKSSAPAHTPGKNVVSENTYAIELENVNVWYKNLQILKSLQIGFLKKSITCIIGPSGGGKSTLIRSIDRINDETEGFKLKGSVLLNGVDVYSDETDVSEVRRRIGMVFQKPTVFPRSILENVVFGLLPYKKLSKSEALEIAETHLKAVFLWKEVSHRLHEKATTLSIGQQQRLCIARTLALKPEVLLLDEPTSSLDPVAAAGIESLILQLKKDYTIIIVTHNLNQAKRVADQVVFLHEGSVVEIANTNTFFDAPNMPQTRDYIKRISTGS
jgi:phosphate transport system ATP-binding protein